MDLIRLWSTTARTNASSPPHLPQAAVLTPLTHLNFCGVQRRPRSHRGVATRTRQIKGEDFWKLQRQHTSAYGSHFPPLAGATPECHYPPHQLQHTPVRPTRCVPRPLRLHLHPLIYHLHLQWIQAASAISNGIINSGYSCWREELTAIPICIMPAIVPAPAVALVVDNDRDPSPLCQSVNHPRNQQ
jgi:hypothetical protein